MVPIAFQNFMLAAVSASDAIMLGFLNQDFLSAVSLAGQIQFMHSLFLAALVIGTTMLVAQYWGAKEYGDRLGKLSLFCGILSGLQLLAISPF